MLPSAGPRGGGVLPGVDPSTTIQWPSLLHFEIRWSLPSLIEPPTTAPPVHPPSPTQPPAPRTALSPPSSCLHSGAHLNGRGGGGGLRVSCLSALLLQPLCQARAALPRKVNPTKATAVTMSALQRSGDTVPAVNDRHRSLRLVLAGGRWRLAALHKGAPYCEKTEDKRTKHISLAQVQLKGPRLPAFPPFLLVHRLAPSPPVGLRTAQTPRARRHWPVIPHLECASAHGPHWD